MQKFFSILMVIIWLFFIFILSSIPSVAFGPPLFFWQGLVAHLILFAVLAYLLIKTILNWGENKAINWQIIFYVIAFCFFYCITDEYHQGYVIGRSVSFTDLGSDGLGGAIGILFFWLKGWRKKPKLMLHISRSIARTRIISAKLLRLRI